MSLLTNDPRSQESSHHFPHCPLTISDSGSRIILKLCFQDHFGLDFSWKADPKTGACGQATDLEGNPRDRSGGKGGKESQDEGLSSPLWETGVRRYQDLRKTKVNEGSQC